jgi:hypothetical protein
MADSNAAAHLQDASSSPALLSLKNNETTSTAPSNAFDTSPTLEVPRVSSDARHSTEQSQKYPRLSKPVELLRNTYDVVVIGSGYGGGVSASRLARGGQSVCVLERGKERWRKFTLGSTRHDSWSLKITFPAGEYPSSLLEAVPNFHVQGQFTPGNTKGKYVETGDPLGLYRLVYVCFSNFHSETIPDNIAWQTGRRSKCILWKW